MIKYSQYTDITDKGLQSDVKNIAKVVFGDGDRVFDYLSHYTTHLIITAHDGNKIIGFKVGYAHNANLFYSWLGGVHPDHRGQGIALEMMKRQHDWCRAQNYTQVETRTKNKWRNMLILNIKNGFDVRGTFTEDNGETKIILRKEL